MSCRHWHKRASRCFERRTVRCVTSEWQNAALCKAASFESNVYFSGRAYVVASVNKPFALCIFYFMQRWKDWQTQMTVFCRATKISRRTRLIGVTKLLVIRLMFHGIFTDRVSGHGYHNRSCPSVRLFHRSKAGSKCGQCHVDSRRGGWTQTSACVWLICLPRRGLKFKVIGQGLGLSRIVIWSVGLTAIFDRGQFVFFTIRYEMLF